MKAKATIKKEKSNKIKTKKANIKAIIVTGTPCTGKTTLSKTISKKYGYSYIDINSVVKKYGLDEEYDKKRKCYIVDEKKLSKVMETIIKESEHDLVIDSHMSDCINPKYIDTCIVTRCNLKKLRSRLKKRGYDKNKIDENMECEIMQICLSQAQEAGHKIIEIDTTSKIKDEDLKKIIGKIKKNPKKEN